jgi:PadR family transcriptional regulator, regulatory protein PadR
MRVTGPLLKVLRSFLEAPGHEVYGLELARATGLKSGTLYPILDRLESRGWVSSRWEERDPAEMGRPRRRFYQLTGIGQLEGREILVEHGVGTVQWA